MFKYLMKIFKRHVLKWCASYNPGDLQKARTQDEAIPPGEKPGTPTSGLYQAKDGMNMAETPPLLPQALSIVVSIPALFPNEISMASELSSKQGHWLVLANEIKVFFYSRANRCMGPGAGIW